MPIGTTSQKELAFVNSGHTWVLESSDYAHISQA